MKRIHKVLFGLLVMASALAVGSCSSDTETIYIEPEMGIGKFDVSPLSVSMGYADDVSLIVSVRPGNTQYTWTSSDPSIAYVDENNKIIPQGIGEVALTCSAGVYSQTIPVQIHSSIVLERNYLYLDLNAESAIEEVKILPEGIGFTLSSADEAVVKVPSATEQKVVAVGSGETTLSIETADGITAQIPVGVASGEKITPSSAVAYFYNGTRLRHVGYGISAFALTPSSASYTDGGNWSGTGKALFLKVYNASQADFAEIPNGEYTQGQEKNNFFPRDSYVIDVESGTKSAITAGQLSITDEGVQGYVTAGSTIYKVEYTGSRTEAVHTWPYDQLIYNYTAADFGSCSVTADHSGTIFYGGYGNAWNWKLGLNGGGTLQLVIVSKVHDNPNGTYKASPEFFVNNTLVCMGWGTTSQYKGANITSGEVTVKDCNYDYNAGASSVVASLSGVVSYVGTDPVTEINESQSMETIINLDIQDLTLKLYDYK